MIDDLLFLGVLGVILGLVRGSRQRLHTNWMRSVWQENLWRGRRRRFLGWGRGMGWAFELVKLGGQTETIGA